MWRGVASLNLLFFSPPSSFFPFHRKEVRTHTHTRGQEFPVKKIIYYIFFCDDGRPKYISFIERWAFLPGNHFITVIIQEKKTVKCLRRPHPSFICKLRIKEKRAEISFFTAPFIFFAGNQSWSTRIMIHTTQASIIFNDARNTISFYHNKNIHQMFREDPAW